MRTLSITIITILLVIGGVATAPSANASTGCRWITTEVSGNGYAKPAGTKECSSWSTVKRISTGAMYTTCNQGYRVVMKGSVALYCKMGDYAYTTSVKPIAVGSPGSKARSIANAQRAFAKKHGFVLQFAKVDELGRKGCPASNPTWLASGYTRGEALGHPGGGLIRIGLGDNPSTCLKYWTKAKNHSGHELAHGIVEEKCGTTRPPIMDGRVEPVTGAYAHMYLGNTDNTSTSFDRWAAKQIHYGNCG